VTCYACKGPHYRYQCQKYPYCKKCKTNFPCEYRYKHHRDEVDQECNAKPQGKYGLSEEAWVLARRLGITIVPDDSIEEEVIEVTKENGQEIPVIEQTQEQAKDNSYSEQIQYSQSPQNEKYSPYTRDEHYLSYTQNPQYPPYPQDHQDYPYYSNHYENEEYMMQPYEEENTEDMKNKILARIEELEQEMANIRKWWKQECRQRTSSLENEEGDTHGNTFEPTHGSEYENVEEKESVEGKENSETKKRSEEETPVLEENLIHERENQIRVQVQEESDDDMEIVWEDEKSNGDTFGFKSGNILDLTCVTTFGDICAKSCENHAFDVCDDLCVACDDVVSSNFCDESYDDSFDHNCGDAYIENVVGNVDCVDNGVEKVVDMPSENNCIIEDVDNEVNFFNPCVFNDSDSFDSDDDD